MLIINDTLRNVILARILYAATSSNNQWVVKLFSGAMPATSTLLTIQATTYTTGQVWSSSAASTPISLQVAGDLFSIGGGDSTFNATATGPVQWAMIYKPNANTNIMFTDSIGLTGTTSVVQLSSTTATSGQPLSLYALNFRILGN